jgi:AcrR family transcriptional regulator
MARIATSIAKAHGLGRPRSEETRRLILKTTLSLLENETLQSISIERIAREAGVSKATIYRWWSSKVSVVIDAFIEHHVINTPMMHDVEPREAIAQHMRSLARQYAGWGGQIVAQILAEAQSDPDIRREFHERFHNSRREMVRGVLNAWRASGQIGPDVDAEILMDVLYGPIYMRLLIGHAPLTDQFMEDLQNFLFPLIEASKRAAS